MWAWDLHQEDAPIAASSPQILPIDAASSSPSTAPPQPVIVPNVETLKEQFQQQESILAHIRETLRENDADLSTKEKQLEMYANKLSQIKSRSKVHRKQSESTPRQSPRENREDGDNKLTAKGKTSELKKRLEENKKHFEQHTEKGITETKKIESMVEQLRTQVLESDATIHELQKSIDTPTAPRPKLQTLPRRHKEKPLLTSKWTQTLLLDEGETKLKELETMVVDLQDTVKQQTSVIAARTKAVALLSEDLSKKGKTTVDELEDTRREMREMQAKFVAVEIEFKSSLLEKDNRLLDLEEKLAALKTENAQLIEKNLGIEAELNNRNIQSAAGQNVEQSTMVQNLEKKVEELTSELEDSNKLMIRLTLEHKNKLKAVNKSLNNKKPGPDENTEIQKMSTKVDELLGEKGKLQSIITELEEEKGNLLLSLLDYDELKASFLARSNDWQSLSNTKEAEIEELRAKLAIILEEKQTLLQNIEDQNILIDNLHARIENNETANVEFFGIPGDSACRQFSASNQHVQTEIDGLVKEKQDLFDKLKNLSSSFENVGIQSEISAIAPNLTDNEELVTQKARVAELEAKVADLETSVAKPGSKAINTLKNKLKKLENDLKKNKTVIDELNEALKVKNQIIDEMNGKLLSDNIDNSWSNEAMEEMQKKCLTSESSFLQITEQCERLRKENIEVVHQLSGEKVRRIRAEEEAEAVRIVFLAAQELETRVAVLEAAEPPKENSEYTNIVIAGKDTEIFNLQSSLADKAQALDAAAEEHKRSCEEVEDLRNLIQQREYEIQLLQLNLQNAEQQASDLKQSVRLVSGQLSNEQRAMAEVNENLSADLNFKLNELEKLKIENNNLQDALKVTGHKLNAERAVVEELTSNRDGYFIKIAKQRDEALIKVEETEKVLQKTWEERNELIQAQDRCFKQIAKMESQLSELSANYTALNQIHVGCQTELDNLKKELSNKQQEFENLTLKAKKFAANLKKKASVEKELGDLVNSLQREGELLNKQLIDSQEIVEEKNEKIQQLLDQQAMLNNDQTNLNSYKEQTTALMEEIKKLGCRIEDLLAENTGYAVKNQSLEQQINAMETSFTNISEKLESAFSENNLMKVELAKFEEALVVEKSEKDAINELLKKASNDLKALHVAFEMEEQENQTLLAQKTDMLQEIDKYSANITKLTSENHQIMLELDNLKQLEETYKMLMDEKMNIEHELINKVKSIEMYEERVNDLLRSTQDLHDLKSKLLTENETLNRGKLESLEQLEQYKQWEEKYNYLLEEKTFLENERNQLMSSFETRLADSQEIINKLETDNKTLHEKLLMNDEHFATSTGQMEKQINNFNVAFEAEVGKNAALKTEMETLVLRIKELESANQSEKPERKKKKSVTFNTEDTDYIKELRGEVATLQRALGESDATVGELKAALGEKPEAAAKTFTVGLFAAPPSGDFFDQFPSQEPNDPFAEDSLQWDDSWGAEGQLEADHAISKASEENTEKITKLEAELKGLYYEKEAAQEELRVLQVKYSKLIKKLKEQKLIIDRLQGEAKNNSSLGDLEAAMVDEMRVEMGKLEKKENDLLKERDSLKHDNEVLLKKIDTLNVGNEKYLELKERQSNDAAVWQNQQSDLRAEITDLKAQLLEPADDSKLTQQNRELKNLIEALEWKVSELTEMIDEKDEELTHLSHSTPAQVQETPACSNCHESVEKLIDTQQQLEALVTENEELQGFIRNEMDKTRTAPAPAAASALSQFFPPQSSVRAESLFDACNTSDAKTSSDDREHLKDLLNVRNEEIAKAQSLQEEQNYLIILKEDEIKTLQNEYKDMQRAYNESKAEIERLLREDQLRTDNVSEEELAQVKQEFESEKLKYESIIKTRDLELKSLQETLGSTERDWDETQGRNDDVIQQLKAQLRELDATAARSLEDKDVELHELRAQCEELREVCKSREENLAHLRRELLSASDTNASTGQQLRNEYEIQLTAANEALREKTEQLSGVQAQLKQQEIEIASLRNISEELHTLQKRLATKESEFTNLLQQSSSIEAEFLLRDAEARELRAELFTKNAEQRELQSDMQEMRNEVSQFRNFDKQLLEIRSTQGEGSLAAAPGWNQQESDDLCARLQSDLDATLYHLHQRDVRCDELTLELTQLLEERDVLQLRLSTEIRQNEELRMTVDLVPHSAHGGNMRNLAEKISELHTVGYKRDKNLQDDSQQRHREQMALLGRETRGKMAKPVFDI